MDQFLAQGIKAVITDYPEVGKILDEYKIGCTTCGVGTCLLRDVVVIHNLPPQTEAELMYRIEKAIYPHRDVQEPQVRVEPVKPQGLKYSPPLQVLVDEHKIIKRWLSLIPQVIEYLDVEPETAWNWVEQGAELIRNFADKYHHAKEEKILFSYAAEDMEIIQVMYEDHRTGRAHRQEIADALETRNKEQAAHHLLAYRDLLTEHIRKEDEILYPWLDRGLTDTQVGAMFAQFQAADIDSGSPQKYIDFVENLERILS